MFFGSFFLDVELTSIPALHGPLASHPAPPQCCGSTHAAFLKFGQLCLSKYFSPSDFNISLKGALSVLVFLQVKGRGGFVGGELSTEKEKDALHTPLFVRKKSLLSGLQLFRCMYAALVQSCKIMPIVTLCWC